MKDKLTEDQFIKTIAPRFGGQNAINQLHPAQQAALINLLVSNGLILREELEAETHQELAKIAKNMMSMPIPSPVQL